MRSFFFICFSPLPFLSFLSLSGLVSCSQTVSNKDIPTNKVRVEYTALGLDNQVRGSARFFLVEEGGKTQLKLSQGESLKCQVGEGNLMPLQEKEDVRDEEYFYDGNCGGEPGAKKVTFEFTRSANESYTSTVQLPPPIQGAMYDPTPANPLPSGEVVTLKWTPAVGIHRTTIDLVPHSYENEPKKDVIETLENKPNTYAAIVTREVSSGDKVFEVREDIEEDLNFVIIRSQDGEMGEGLNGKITGFRTFALPKFRFSGP